MTPQDVVGTRPDPEQLPRGPIALLRACRAAGGWFAWVTEGRIVKPVKVTAAADTSDGHPVYEDRPHRRLLVKGRHPDGRRFVVQYLADAKGHVAVASGYIGLAGHMHPAGVTDVRAYVDVPSKPETQEV